MDRLRVRFEKAVTTDVRALSCVSQQAFDNDVHYGAPGPGGPPGYDTDTWQIKMMTAGEYYKILLDGRIIGGLVVRLRGYRYYEVTRIFIEPQSQNRGIGTRTFEFLWSQYPEVERWRHPRLESAHASLLPEGGLCRDRRG